MKNKCVIFILKNDETFLVENINKILEMQKKYDLYFVTRDSKDRTNQLLKLNNLINIELPYDSGYYEALKTGFEFVNKLNYKSWIEFGECGILNIEEIERLDDINQNHGNEGTIISAAHYVSNKKNIKFKWYIKLFVNLKIVDPYTRLKIYNHDTFDLIKLKFDFKIHPQEFINLLWKTNNFIEVYSKSLNKKNKYLKIYDKFQFFIYTFFIIPFIKRY